MKIPEWQIARVLQILHLFNNESLQIRVVTWSGRVQIYFNSTNFMPNVTNPVTLIAQFNDELWK